ncbi:MAG: ATP-dependent DNA ligase [Chloroflexota bacterium]
MEDGDVTTGGFSGWCALARAVAATGARSGKVASVAAYLRALGPAELPIVVTFLTGRALPPTDPRTTGLGWAAIAAAAEAVAGVPPGSLGAAYDRSSDMGTAVRDLLAGAGHAPGGPPPTLGEVADAFGAIAAARGPAARGALLAALLRRADAQAAWGIVRILTGDLRIGLRAGHVEAAIAAAFARPPAAVARAAMLTGDLARTAELARDDALADARLALFVPVLPMLASPAADAADVFARMPAPAWVEDKLDGIRAQLHVADGRARIWSRDLRDVSDAFPEIVAAAGELGWDGILDGEIVGMRDGSVLPFHALQARLGRKAPSDAVRAEVPVILVAFDLLAHGPGGGASVAPLFDLPLRERRARLDALALDRVPGFGLTIVEHAADAAALDAHFAAARARGNEGLMVKDPASAYMPGRRGIAWLKLKRPLATLDCVVTGVETGHGKRHGVLSDYTFAVRDDRPGAPDGRLVTIGKAYTGLTDAELAEMTRWFTDHTLSRHGRFRVVEPTVVVEIAFDVVMASPRHASGFALRFPRIVRIRTDKDAADADALSAVAALHAGLAAAGRVRIRTTATEARDPAG